MDNDFDNYLRLLYQPLLATPHILAKTPVSFGEEVEQGTVISFPAQFCLFFFFLFYYYYFYCFCSCYWYYYCFFIIVDFFSNVDSFYSAPRSCSFGGTATLCCLLDFLCKFFFFFFLIFFNFFGPGK